MPRKKEQFLPPRRKRMTRPARLESVKATCWVERYSGKDIVKGYARWFGVDLLCAVNELRLLGEEISVEREKQLLVAIEARAAARMHRGKEGAHTEFETFHADCNDELFCITGYAWQGMPYNEKWEEAGEDLPF